jgi:hypothetical protein
MAPKTIFDGSKVKSARDVYSATLARMTLPELLYHALTRDESPSQIASAAKDAQEPYSNR